MIDRLPGFRDFYPEPLPHKDVWSADARNYLFEIWRGTARAYGFREYDGPPVEALELYTAKSGQEIVGQLYNFVDKGQREVSLRPEMTPTLARMAAACERQYKKPIKWFSLPQLFRYERQQKGRLREHFQFNADILGECDPAADAELIALVIDVLRNLKLTADDFVVRLSSRNAWQQFYRDHDGEESREYEFFQLIDKLERTPPEESEKKLEALGFKLEQIQQFIQQGEPTGELRCVTDDLAARGMNDYVKVDYQVIRGLAYYTGAVFEVFDRKGEFRAIAGGGRYDNLVKLISGGKVDLPALGVGMGDVVLLELLKSRKLLPAFSPNFDVYFLIENEDQRLESIRQIQQLRECGFSVEFPLTRLKSDKQFKRALELNVRFTVALDGDFGASRRVRVKDLNIREEHLIPMDELKNYLSGESGHA